MPEESKVTKRARQKIIEMYQKQGFKVSEEELFPCNNDMGEPITPFYRGDIVLRKTFIIELDPLFHGSRIHRNKDYWRNINIFKQYDSTMTVRIDPADILKEDPYLIIMDVNEQLRTFKERHNLA